MTKSAFDVSTLGECRYTSPIEISHSRFQDESKRLAFEPHLMAGADGLELQDRRGFELAGPREHIYFDPLRTRVAIVSCGGLCPGINAVIRALVMQLWYRYGCQQIWGGLYGFHGLAREFRDKLLPLDPELLTPIHETGGSFLGSSRGTPPAAEIVDTLAHHKIDILFTIGGDGTMRGAQAIHAESQKRGYKLAIVGVPKTIDNDIPYVRQSFGFETAVSIACQALRSAHHEARGYLNGIGLVRLMGRHSGYIAATASLAVGHVNFCLVPEVPFYLEGENGLLALVAKRLASRKHAVIVVAEGAGQHYVAEMKTARDASGNLKLGNIGEYLQERLGAHFANTPQKAVIKYIDPSYLIRSAPPNPADLLFCARLAQNAVHAAMAGKTNVVIGYWHGNMTHVPLEALSDYRQAINPAGSLWFNVLETTGQPHFIGSREAFCAASAKASGQV